MATVPTELDLLASRIKAAHKSITEHTRNIVDRAIEAGDALNQAKAKFDHGQWLLWLKNNCELSERNAQIYMQLANNKSMLKSAEAADLSTLDPPTKQLDGKSFAELLDKAIERQQRANRPPPSLLIEARPVETQPAEELKGPFPRMKRRV